VNNFIKDNKIKRIIIKAISVDMMDNLVLSKGAVKFFRHYISMFCDIAIFSCVGVIRNIKMIISLDDPFTFISRMIFVNGKMDLIKTFFRANRISELLNSARITIYRFTAIFTLCFNHIPMIPHIHNSCQGENNV
jgi:hypothetical protein